MSPWWRSGPEQRRFSGAALVAELEDSKLPAWNRSTLVVEVAVAEPRADQHLHERPLSGTMFVFTNRRRPYGWKTA